MESGGGENRIVQERGGEWRIEVESGGERWRVEERGGERDRDRIVVISLCSEILISEYDMNNK